MAKTDRRAQRTRELLQKTLIELISEQDYDAVTVQDIVDRANVARTTFYVHYNSKDDLFMGCHEAILSEFQSGPLRPHPLSREELLSLEAPPGMAAAYRHLAESRARLYPIFQGKDGSRLLRRIREHSAEAVEANLRAVFSEADSAVPFDLLATYLAGAQIALMQWWLERHFPCSPENLAQASQRMQRAILRDALRLA